jgi:hypothetical protein
LWNGMGKFLANWLIHEPSIVKLSAWAKQKTSEWMGAGRARHSVRTASVAGWLAGPDSREGPAADFRRSQRPANGLPPTVVAGLSASVGKRGARGATRPTPARRERGGMVGWPGFPRRTCGGFQAKPRVREWIATGGSGWLERVGWHSRRARSDAPYPKHPQCV